MEESCSSWGPFSFGRNLSDENQVPELALGTHGGLRRCARSDWVRWRQVVGWEGRNWGQLGLNFGEQLLVRGTPQAVGADFDKALGQHVLEEAPDEILGGQSQVAQLLRTVVAIAKGDVPGFDRFQSAVGEGNPEDVAGQVIQDLLAGARVLAVDIPGLMPAREAGIQASELFETGFDLGAEDLTQGIAGDQELGMAGRDPGGLGGEAAGGN